MIRTKRHTAIPLMMATLAAVLLSIPQVSLAARSAGAVGARG